MEKALRAYMEVLRLVRRLPPDTRAYYSKYARENFVNYRELDDPSSLPDLLHRAYSHSCWVLSKVLFFSLPPLGCVVRLGQYFPVIQKTVKWVFNHSSSIMFSNLLNYVKTVVS